MCGGILEQPQAGILSPRLQCKEHRSIARASSLCCKTLFAPLQSLRCSTANPKFTTGVRFDRKELLAALAYLNEGDTLVVWKLDRLGRSLKQLIETVEKLKASKINLVSLTEHLDTTTATGMLFFQFVAMLAEFERNLISERTRAGLEAARARGRKGGRPSVLATSKKVKLAQQLYADKSNSVADICKTLHISKATLYHYVISAKSVLDSWPVAVGLMTTNVILRSAWMENRRYRQYLEEERNSSDPNCWSLFSLGERPSRGMVCFYQGNFSLLANPW
jgi:DNA invertase Pin-like site-specific DNA recombinase